jgi:hypothetical protein
MDGRAHYTPIRPIVHSPNRPIAQSTVRRLPAAKQTAPRGQTDKQNNRQTVPTMTSMQANRDISTDRIQDDGKRNTKKKNVSADSEAKLISDGSGSNPLDTSVEAENKAKRDESFDGADRLTSMVASVSGTGVRFEARGNTIAPVVFGFPAWVSQFTVLQHFPLTTDQEVELAQRLELLVPCSICQHHYAQHSDRYDIVFLVQMYGLEAWLIRIRREIQRRQACYLPDRYRVQTVEEVRNQFHPKTLNPSARMVWMEQYLHCLLWTYPVAAANQQLTVRWFVQTYMNEWFPWLKTLEWYTPAQHASKDKWVEAALAHLYRNQTERRNRVHAELLAKEQTQPDLKTLKKQRLQALEQSASAATTKTTPKWIFVPIINKQ